MHGAPGQPPEQPKPMSLRTWPLVQTRRPARRSEGSMQFQNRFLWFMNDRAPANGRYKPTCYEHAANCYTHAFLIVPAIMGSVLLHLLSDNYWEKITAWIYGMGLCALFIVSTVFHMVSWKKSHLRTVERCFHMCWGPIPAGPGVPKGVDGVGEEGMTRRQPSVDQQPSQDL